MTPLLGVEQLLSVRKLIPLPQLRVLKGLTELSIMMSFLAVQQVNIGMDSQVEVVTILFQVMLVMTEFMERMVMMSLMVGLVMTNFMVVMVMTLSTVIQEMITLPMMEVMTR